MKDKAEEFLRDKFCGDPILTETILRSHFGNGQTLAELMTEFLDQQSKEEAKERYEKAVEHYKKHGRMKLGQFNMLVLDTTIRIASGKDD